MAVQPPLMRKLYFYVKILIKWTNIEKFCIIELEILGEIHINTNDYDFI